MVEGPEAALASVEELSAEPAMKNYYLLPAVRADFLRRLGRSAEAAACYQEALTYPCTEPERRFLLRRIDGLKAEQQGYARCAGASSS
jgi:RNA polymerase sigma-70 factor (ECF subfamily)